MTDLVALEDAKAALRIDFDDDDATLALYISAASDAVVDYLKSQAEELIDFAALEESPADWSAVPPAIRTAVIMLVGHFLREPDGNGDGAFTGGDLPKPVVSILYRLRDPSLA